MESIETHGRRISTSHGSILRNRLYKIHETNLNCCAIFVKLVINEVKTYNLPVSVICKTSPLSLRVTRLAFLYFTILVQFTFSAIYYNIYPSED